MKRSIVLLAATAGLAACQTAPTADSGFLAGYDGLTTREDTIRASIRERRGEAVAAGIERVVLEPAVMVGDAGEALSAEEVRAVLREVDRQVCYEVSERFTVVPNAQGAARVRVGVTGVRPTGQAGSGLSAVANVLIPGPGSVRVPGTTGGLAAEAELLAGTGDQVAALSWARDANVVGMDSPSTSRIGDALQLAEPFGDAVGDAFAPSDRAVREIGDPDPCAVYGPRTQPAGFLTRVVTGVYVPEVNTGSRPADAPRE